MRTLLLLLGIIFLFDYRLEAQWEKLSTGTKLYYECKFFKIDEGRSNDTIYKTCTTYCIELDTTITLLGKHRKLILFSGILDSYGGSNFDVPSGIDNTEVLGKKYLFNKNMCTLFYTCNDTIYAFATQKSLGNSLRSQRFINLLKDSLSTNYVTFEDRYGQTHFSIMGIDFFLQPFRLLKSKKSERNDSYFHQYMDEYSGFYTRYKGGNSNQYICPQRRCDADLKFVYGKGIVESYTHYVSEFSNIYILKMKDIKITK